jgi:Kef-type K+ transport system membrane component KefB
MRCNRTTGHGIRTRRNKGILVTRRARLSTLCVALEDIIVLILLLITISAIILVTSRYNNTVELSPVQTARPKR